MGFAAGFRSGMGLVQARRQAEADEEDRKYQREQRDRENQIRSAAADTLGRVGQERTTDYQMAPNATGSIDDDGTMVPVKTPYSARQGYQDYASRIAGLDPIRSIQARGYADQEEARGLQVSAARRAEKYANNEDAFMAFMQENGGLPDHEFMRKAAVFASKHVPDGRSFGIDFDHNTGYQAVMVGPDGSVQRQPIPNRRALEQQLAMYVSPQMYKQTQTQQRLDRTDERLDRTLAATTAHQERTDATMAGYRADQKRLIEAQAGYYNRRGEGGARSPRDRVAEMTQTADAYAQVLLKSKRAKTPEEAQQMAWGLVLKDRNATQGEGLRAVTGSKGLFTDGQNYFRLNEEDNSMVPVRTPASISKVAETIRQNLGKKPAAAEAPAAAAPARSGLLSPEDRERIGAGRSPAEQHQIRNEIIRQRQEEARGLRVREAEVGEEAYRARGLDPNRAYFGR